jgi:hypothetical protein
MSCKVIKTFVKTPWEELDYPISYSRLLEADETIVTSEWVVDSGITEVATDQGTTATAITLGGGLPENVYLASNRITTSEGRSYERAIRIRVCAPS